MSAEKTQESKPGGDPEEKVGYTGDALVLYRAEYSSHYSRLAGLHPDKSEDELHKESHQAAVRSTDLKMDRL